MSPAPVIRVGDVSKRFELHHDRSLKERVLYRSRGVEEFWALRNVAFDLEPGHTLGLIGANGSGKTTLLKLIGGILTPTTGFVERRGRVAALLELGAGFHPDLTGRENVYLNASILGLTREQTDSYFDAIVDFSGIERFMDNQVKFYSSGMYVRLAFAVAVHVEPEILLVDEVLAVGDEPFQRKCLARIKQFQSEGRTIIFVTHGLDMVRELCDRALLLDRGEVAVDGKPQEAIRALRERFDPAGPSSDMAGGEGGNRQMVILKSSVTGGDGVVKEVFEPGDPFGLDIMVEAVDEVDDPVVGIAIHNHLDMLVYGTNTKIRGVDLGRVRGRRLVRFHFGDLPMVEGNYAVEIGLHSRDEETKYHWIDRAASFKVVNTAGAPGVVHLNPVIEVADA